MTSRELGVPMGRHGLTHQRPSLQIISTMFSTNSTMIEHAGDRVIHATETSDHLTMGQAIQQQDPVVILELRRLLRGGWLLHSVVLPL